MDNILTDLMNYALWKQHINVIMTGEASLGTPSVAFPDARQKALSFNPTNIDYPVELAANRFAVKMLMPYYLDERDRERVSVNEFMNLFVIPAHLENMCREELIKAM